LPGAHKIAAKLKDTLSTPNKLSLDKKELEEALTLAQRLPGVLRSIPGLSQAARDSVDRLRRSRDAPGVFGLWGGAV